jgi:hypothetical protein
MVDRSVYDGVHYVVLSLACVLVVAFAVQLLIEWCLRRARDRYLIGARGTRPVHVHATSARACTRPVHALALAGSGRSRPGS